MNPSASVALTHSSDALQLILAKLESMQGRLEKSSVPITRAATSREAVTADISSDEEGDRDRLQERHRTRRLSVEEDDHASLHDGSTEFIKSKRHRSPSPSLTVQKKTTWMRIHHTDNFCAFFVGSSIY